MGAFFLCVCKFSELAYYEVWSTMVDWTRLTLLHFKWANDEKKIVGILFEYK